ncbi:MAG: hypothetical protein R6X31_08650 [Anaerolineae bacterium]
MADVEYKKLIMAGPMRWITLTQDGRTTTLAWFVRVHYTIYGTGNVLFARSDLEGDGHDDIFAVFGDDVGVAKHLRDHIFNYSIFAGAPDRTAPAPIKRAFFESQDDAPAQIVESMRAVDGTTLTLSLRGLGPPKAYVREVNELVTEVGAFAEPDDYSLVINNCSPVGQPEVGPLAEAPPVGADLQNLWYET